MHRAAVSRPLAPILPACLPTSPGFAEDAKLQPAPKVDRVVFPQGYQTAFEVLRQFPRGSNQVVTIHGYAAAAKVTGLHVMRRGETFGEAYEYNRAGRWVFTEYRADGSYLMPPEKSAACAECHIKAGEEHDCVFRGRLPEAKQ